MPINVAGRRILLTMLATFPVCAASQPVLFQQVAVGFEFGTDLQFAPADPTPFVSEQDGVILVVEAGAPRSAPFLDIRDRVVQVGESGLLGFAFDPEWPADPYVYVHYTRELPTSPVTYQAVFSRFQADPVSRIANPGSETVLLRITKPYDGPDRTGAGHQGGSVVFGNDGLLYLTVGDAQQSANAQTTTNLLGTVLRLDVNGGGTPLDCGEGPGLATVPPGNPLADGPGGNCDEIFAFGLRNPWRMSLDAATGSFWIGDVGEGMWEEVDVLSLGANYGWPMMEGNHCAKNFPGCDQTGLTLPVWEYPRTEGQAITGGYVYRGSSVPSIAGYYVYADFVSGRVWALDPASGSNVLLGSRTNLTTSFGRDPEGELYLLDFVGGIDKILPGPVSTTPDPAGRPAELSLSGPSPVVSRSSLRAVSGVDGPGRIVLVDELGRQVALLFEGLLEAGVPRVIPIDASGLAPGLYLARLTSAGGARSLRLTVSR